MSGDEKWRCLISEILKVGKREHLVEAIYNREGGDKFKISIFICSQNNHVRKSCSILILEMRELKYREIR